MTHDHLEIASQALVRTVDGLDDDAYGGPSLLPGWSRAHVVAHLALNAEALAGALRGVLEGVPVPMYAAAGGRDADIDELATARAGALRDRLLGSTTLLAGVLRGLRADVLGTAIERTPGSGRAIVAGDVMLMRWIEVEVHHVDLDAGRSPDDWPAEFATLLLARTADPGIATLVATDLGRSWQGESGTPTVSGTAADLGWWLSGRGAGEGLQSDGALPRIEAW